MFIEFDDVAKNYVMGDITIQAVHDCFFDVKKGELVVILGPSGAGKTTILNLLGGMDTCSSGQIRVGEQRVDQYSSRQLTKYRRNDIGFVFQFYNLIQNLTVLENVELATQLCKDALDVREILSAVGLQHRLNNFPSQLSGGEQQRVAIARAIAKNPLLLLCDEPTGALDSETSTHILELLKRVNRDYGMTCIIITHNQVIAKMADRVIKVLNGTVNEVIRQDHPLDVKELIWV